MISKPVTKARRRPVRLTLLAVGGLLCGGLLIDGFLVEPNRLERREVTLACPGLVNGPVRILLFSDVNHTGPDRMEDAIRDAAAVFGPDLVFVAGDLIDTPAATRRGEVLESAEEFLASLPAPSGRFLAPGEVESPSAKRLRDAWPAGAVEFLSNEARMVEVRGEHLDLFVADPAVDPAPWTLGSEAGRPFVFSRGRHVNQLLVYQGPGLDDWRENEITFSFQALEPGALLELRFAWQGAPPILPGPIAGGGWQLVRNEYRPDFRLYHYAVHRRRLAGRIESGFVPPARVWCRARIRLTDEGQRARVRARFWAESSTEPADWSIDATDDRPAGPVHGTVALGGRSGGRRYADLRITGAGGRVLLEEPFRDPARLRKVWTYRSALADWLFGAGPSGAARIVLVHNPDLVLDVADIAGPKPGLVLAGHTHGGQVRLPLFGALYTSTRLGRRYDRGLFVLDGFPLYITAGTGTSVIPVRLFDPPEVTLLTLVPPHLAPEGGTLHREHLSERVISATNSAADPARSH